jgi:YgiT-type zinc finger domain-containing protein
MIGKHEREHKGTCPLCGGQLQEGLATLPFIFDSTVVIVKDVPAEICEECGEPYMKGMAAEISVIHYKAA